jgi:hypothetical protein
MGLQMNMTITEYDAIEVNPVAAWHYPGTGETSFEKCEPNDPTLSYWSVYLHLKAGGVEHIADCPTEQVMLLVAGALAAQYSLPIHRMY